MDDGEAKRDRGYAPLWRCVFESSAWVGTSACTKLVLMVIIGRMQHRGKRSGTCTVQVGELAKTVEHGETAVRAAIKTLVADGFMTAKRRQTGLEIQVVNWQRWMVKNARADQAETLARRSSDPRQARIPPYKEEVEEDPDRGSRDPRDQDPPVSASDHRALARGSESEGLVPELPRDSGYKRVVDAYFEHYRAAYESKPRWGGKHGKQLNELLASHGPDEVHRRLETMFEAPPSWLRPPYTWESFHRHFDALVEAADGGGLATPAWLLRRAAMLKEQGR